MPHGSLSIRKQDFARSRTNYLNTYTAKSKKFALVIWLLVIGHWAFRHMEQCNDLLRVTTKHWIRNIIHHTVKKYIISKGRFVQFFLKLGGGVFFILFLVNTWPYPIPDLPLHVYWFTTIGNYDPSLTVTNFLIPIIYHYQREQHLSKFQPRAQIICQMNRMFNFIWTWLEEAGESGLCKGT